MSRLAPVEVTSLDNEMQQIIAAGVDIMGFSSNDALLMAHQPDMLKAMLGLVQAVYQSGSLPLGLKKLVAVMTSSAAGCQYCQAHTQYGAMREGVSAEKLAAIWEYQSSTLFSDAERAALEVAHSAALSPNTTTDQSFSKLNDFFSTEQIVELVGVISLFGFLNRWNSTMATDLEQTPKRALEASGLSIL